MNNLLFFITIPFGVETICKKELRLLGEKDVKLKNGLIEVTSTLDFIEKTTYLKSVNRVFYIIKQGQISKYDDIYNVINSINFESEPGYMVKNFSLNINLMNTEYLSKKTIEAIFYKAMKNKIKKSEEEKNKILFNIFIERDLISLGIDCFGISLHKRGYRVFGGISPIKENLASAIIINELDEKDKCIIDPFCGSSTILTEALLFICTKKNINAAPKIKIGKNLSIDLEKEINLIKKYNCRYFIGSDIDENAIQNSIRNIKNLLKRYFNNNYKYYKIDDLFSIFEIFYDKEKLFVLLANLDSYQLNLKLKNLNYLKELDLNKAIIITNLPYGKRIDKKQTKSLSLSAIKKVFNDFSCKKHFLTSMKYLPSVLNCKEFKKRKLYNGKIEVTLFSYQN